jgi:hypothetical protein
MPFSWWPFDQFCNREGLKTPADESAMLAARSLRATSAANGAVGIMVSDKFSKSGASRGPAARVILELHPSKVRGTKARENGAREAKRVGRSPKSGRPFPRPPVAAL